MANTWTVRADQLPAAPEDLGLDLSDRLWTVQRPFKNGVTIYRQSLWGGNGFGTDVTRIAVLDGRVVAVYDSGRTRLNAVVAGVGKVGSTLVWNTGRTRSYVTRTAFNNWLDAVKSLSPLKEEEHA